MSTSTLPQIWSLDISANANAAPYLAHISAPTPAPSNFDVFFLNNLLLNRWGAHYLSALLVIIPTSETRLRNDGIVTMYNCVRDLISIFKDLAHKRQITVPPFPEIPADWKEEAAIDYKTLHAALLPHVVKPVKGYIEYATELITTEGKYHWTSLVAPLSVSADAYLDTMETANGLVGTIGDKTLAPYTEAVTGKELVESARAMREEIMRIRSRAEDTGWREEEAKGITVEHLRNMKEFFAIVSE